MSRIGKPLIVETAQPRIIPKTLPAPAPEKVEEKEKVPVGAPPVSAPPKKAECDGDCGACDHTHYTQPSSD